MASTAYEVFCHDPHSDLMFAAAVEGVVLGIERKTDRVCMVTWERDLIKFTYNIYIYNI